MMGTHSGFKVLKVTVYVVCVFLYRPVEAETSLCSGQHGEVGGVCVRGSLQGLNQPGGGAQGTGANNVHLLHPEPGENTKGKVKGQLTRH